MPTLRSSTSPKVSLDTWKEKFGGPSTRSATREQDYENKGLSPHEFYSLVDTPSSSIKRNHSSAFAPGFSQAHGHDEIDLNRNDDEPARKNLPIPFRISRANFQSTGSSNSSQLHQQVPMALPASCSLMESDGIIDITQNRHIDQAEDRAKLLTIPAEIHQMIARFIEDDADIAALTLVCKEISTYMSDSVWRERAECKFDRIDGAATSEETAKEYKSRQMMLKTFLRFDRPYSEEHRVCLNRLRDLILQSDARVSVEEGVEEVTALNQDFLKEYIKAAQIRPRRHLHGSNILDVICSYDFFNRFLRLAGQRRVSSRSPGSLAILIQLSLLHLVLDPNICNAKARQIFTSQQQVYQTRTKQPLFIGRNKDEINLTWFVHVANFFKFHLKQNNGEGVLAHTYESLTENERPRAWAGKLDPNSQTQELGKRWKGVFTYVNVEELDQLRGATNEYHVGDEIGHSNNGLLDLTLFFGIDKHAELEFPHRAETVLLGKPTSPLTDHRTNKKSMPEAKDFFGMGYNGNNYHLNGRLHALPPQQDIPGFQRVTMMSYLPKANGDYDEWAWEGLVLPGSQIMLGRWWHADPNGDSSFSGPFIFWQVKESVQDKLKDITSALAFLNEIHWQGL